MCCPPSERVRRALVGSRGTVRPSRAAVGIGRRVVLSHLERLALDLPPEQRQARARGVHGDGVVSNRLVHVAVEFVDALVRRVQVCKRNHLRCIWPVPRRLRVKNTRSMSDKADRTHLRC